LLNEERLEENDCEFDVIVDAREDDAVVRELFTAAIDVAADAELVVIEARMAVKLPLIDPEDTDILFASRANDWLVCVRAVDMVCTDALFDDV